MARRKARTTDGTIPAGLKAHIEAKRAKAAMQPVGLTYDILHDVRRAMRVLRRVEKMIVTAHKAEKRRQAKSREWEESKAIRDEVRGRVALIED